ncbi:MAG: cellulase family glycosylhydrolase [Parachlamydiaceae bacterium]|nr:cellulase family glycosylhydrolase [Parachlamydiaceae bacterium]
MKKNLIKLTFSLICLATTLQMSAMTTKGDAILNSQNEHIELKGVNWFGFNNGSTMVDGIWGGSDTISYDFATVVYRLKLLGFNAVRLPFSFKDIFESTPRNYTQYGTVASLAHIQESVTNPSNPLAPGKEIPPMRFNPIREKGMINDYLPNDSTFKRFLWVINFFAKNGFYVLIDNHLREDQTAIENSQKWVDQWVRLAKAIAKDPISKDHVMFDLLNEPDNFGIRWESSGDKPGLEDLYLSSMDALYNVDPNFLFFIEGAGQSGINANWGDGFATDENLIKQGGLSDPNPFFQALLHKPYVNQVVISPHVYPPSVTYATKDYVGKGLWNRLSSSFGYLSKEGYEGKKFPIAIGEFGSHFTDKTDLQSMKDMADYFKLAGTANDGNHEFMANWFYWSWNANSGDTGGIVADNWIDIQWKKIDYLTQIGLRPWYLIKTKD